MSNRITIVCPSHWENEKRYAIDILFGRLLCVDYDVSFDDDAIDYQLISGNKEFYFKDAFFSRYSGDQSYLNIENIPSKITNFTLQNESKLLMIYGEDVIQEQHNSTFFGIDIIASTFFMTSRWEEFVLGRSAFGKCDEDVLLCVKSNVYDRPIVHEYESFLRDIFSLPASNRKFGFKPTHDVDRCFLSGWVELIQNARRYFSKGDRVKSLRLVKNYIWYKLFDSNPFDTFSFFMEQDVQCDVKSEFYFKSCVPNENGYTYDCNQSFVKNTIADIITHNHVIGFHPSENTINNESQFQKEYKRLSIVANGRIAGGRNHGLYHTYSTHKQWSSIGCNYVSNFGFQKRFGFRCGIAIPFPLYDFQNNTVTSILEVPFELMDTVILRNKPTIDEIRKSADDIISIVKQYNGLLCTNWHTNVYRMREMREYKGIYPYIISSIKVLLDNE